MTDVSLHVNTLAHSSTVNRRASSYTDSLNAVRCELSLTGGSFIPVPCQLFESLECKRI